MEDVVLKELNWKEKIVVKLFAKTFMKVYNFVRINVVNELIK